MKTLKTTTNQRNGNSDNGNGNGHLERAQTRTTTKTRRKSSDDLFNLKVVEASPRRLTIQISSEPRQAERKTGSPWRNPTQFDRPAFLMNFPFSYATGFTNNPWMKDMKGCKRDPDFTRAA